MLIKGINFKKIGLSIVIFLLNLIGFFAVYVFYKSYDWDDKTYLVLTSQYGNASIDIDKYGVPHIVGASDLSAFFALGYVHAKDRLWQMEFQKHLVSGTLSEVLGKYTIEQDKYLRTWGFYQAAKNDWSHFDNKTKAIIKSYTAGVNAYLKRNVRPFELALLFHKPEQWSIYDSYAWGKLIAWQQENIWQDKIINYLLRQKFSHTEVLSITKPPFSSPTTLSEDELNIVKKKPFFQESKQHFFKNNYEIREINQLYELINKNESFSQKMNIKLMPGKGSNAWVISGKLTKSGKPILANDVHLELSSPGIWYLADIKSPNLHVIGATLPGSPAVLIGHNDSIAWGITDAGVDAQEVYILPKNEKFLLRKELINVRGFAQPIEYEVRESRFGPVISSLLDTNCFSQHVAVKWTALLPGDKTIQSFLKVNYAKDWGNFKDALKDFVSPPLNFFYADKMGNIGYYLPGKIPIRKNWCGRYPVTDIKHNQWDGYIPFIELPHTFNPVKGYIVSANNKPVPDKYPYELTYRWREMPYRAQRIIEVLLGNTLIDVPATMRLQLDVKSKLWESFRKKLLEVEPLNQDAKQAIILLRKWDGTMDKDSIAPTIFAFWFEKIKTLQPSFKTYLFQMPNPNFILDELQGNGNFCVLKGYKDCKDFLSKTLSLALVDIKATLGNKQDNWRWGNIHQARFNGVVFGEVKFIGQLWNKVVNSSGGAYTVNMGAYNKDYKQIGAAMYREIIDMNDYENSYFIIATGQSGSLFNRHYADLLGLWSSGKYLRMQAVNKKEN